MKAKLAVTLAALVLSASFFLTSCSGAGETSSTGRSPASQSIAPAPQTQSSSGAPQSQSQAAEPQTLRFSWWGGDARHEARLKAIQLFEAEHRNIRIDAEYGGWDGYYQKLTTMLAAGTEPDIMALSTDWILPLGKSGKTFYNLEQHPEWLDLSGFDKGILASIMSVGGKIQSLPISASNGNIHIFNVDFMKAHGIDPNLEWTWDNMTELGAEIHAADPEAYLIATFGNSTIGHLLKYYVFQNGAAHGWITPDYKLEFTEAELAAGLAYFRGWVDKGVMQPVEETTLYQSPLENPKWLGGKLGMVDVYSAQTSLAVSPDLNLDVAAIPCKTGGVPDYGVTAGPAGCISVSANTKSPEAALRFVNFFFNDMQAVETLNTTHGMQPILAANQHLVEKGLLSLIDFKADEIVTKTRSAKFNLTWQATEFETPYYDNINAVLFGTLTPEQAAAKMMKEMTEAAELMKNAS